MSEREQQVLDLWCIHGTRDAVGKALGIHACTVGTFAGRAMRKMGVEHTTQALIAWDRFAFGRGDSA